DVPRRKVVFRARSSRGSSDHPAEPTVRGGDREAATSTTPWAPGPGRTPGTRAQKGPPALAIFRRRGALAVRLSARGLEPDLQAGTVAHVARARRGRERHELWGEPVGLRGHHDGPKRRLRVGRELGGVDAAVGIGLERRDDGRFVVPADRLAGTLLALVLFEAGPCVDP